LDLGGSFIHGLHGNPITTLANQFRVAYQGKEYNADGSSSCPLETISFQKLSYDVEGNIIPSEIVQKIDLEIEELLENLIDKEFSKDVSLEEALRNHGGRELLGRLQEELKEFIPPRWKNDSLHYIQSIYNLKVSALEGYNGAFLKKLSTKHYGEYKNLPGGDRYLLGGYSSIVEGLLSVIRKNSRENFHIQTNHFVHSIVYNGALRVSGIQIVESDNPSVDLEMSISKMESSFDIEADWVIVTVPLGVLKKELIHFEPPLSDRKSRAIEHLGFGTLDKLFLQFKENFWGGDNYAWIGYASENHGRLVSLLNMQSLSKRNDPILCCFIADEAALEMEQMTDEYAVQSALISLEKHFGVLVKKNFLSAIVTRWAQDRFSYGSYSYMAFGSSPEDIDALAEPLLNGKVCFAGEATQRSYFGTVHGAYLSGQREAERISKYILNP